MAAPRRLITATAALPLIVAPIALAAPAQASSTANEIVYTVDTDEDGVYGVVLRQLDSGRVTTVLPEDPSNGFVYDDPELSPDGTKVVLSTDRGSAAGDFEGLAVVNRDGSGFTRLTLPDSNLPSSTVIDAFPAWSPNGATVLFTRLTFTSAGDETDALWTVPAAGGTATALPGGDGGFTADWSPDGTKVVFAGGVDQNTGVGPLFVMDATGANKTALTGATGALPAWSPDGTTIAYTEVTEFDTDVDRAADIAQISLVPAAGGARTVLTKTRPTSARSVAEYPTWAPDSGSLLFDLYTYDADGFRNAGDLWAIDRGDVRSGAVTSTPTVDEVQGHVQGPALTNVVEGTPSRYVPVDPKRVFDTRPAPDNVGVAPGKLGAAETRTLAVRGLAVTTGGVAGTVPADATAVVLNVTAVNASVTTDIRVYPTPATAVATASSLNATRGLAVPNLVTSQIGSDGAVALRNGAGSVDLLADIAGYYVPLATAGADGFTALSPARVLDTRPAPDNVGAPAAKLGAGGVVDLQATGTLATSGGGSVVVPSDARAVVLNVTATGASQNTDLRVYPTPAGGASDVPLVSNLNVRLGLTAANLVTVTVGDGGKVRLRNGAGSVNVIADIAGYYSASSTGQFVPVAPLRLLDTRDGTGAAATPTTAGAFVDLRVAGSRGVPAGALAAVLNLTATSVSAGTDVRAYPSDASSVPTISNLNLSRGATRANLAVVKPGATGAVRIRNAAGQVHLIGDVAGYFRSPPA
ncbi:MAG: hypothetical protein Q8R60_12980 [Mycobacteriales bacterium]|nr:hypothetical protein [Mycobacteriales bacterium]